MAHLDMLGAMSAMQVPMCFPTSIDPHADPVGLGRLVLLFLVYCPSKENTKMFRSANPAVAQSVLNGKAILAVLCTQQITLCKECSRSGGSSVGSSPHLSVLASSIADRQGPRFKAKPSVTLYMSNGATPNGDHGDCVAAGDRIRFCCTWMGSFLSMRHV